MSAFVVTNATIAYCVAAILSREEWDKRKTADTLPADPVKLGQMLWDMNHDAVGARYDEREDYRRYRHTAVNGKCVQAVKALDCLIYQCSEGNIPDRALYKATVEARDQAMRSCFQRLPEYDKSHWCMPDDHRVKIA